VAVRGTRTVTTIPIVFTTASDPVQIGLVASLARPGRNVTGATILSVELAPKQLEMAHELLPTANSIDVLVNPTALEIEAALREYDAAARALGLDLHILHASTEADFDPVFASLSQIGVKALIVSPDSLFNALVARLGALSLRYAVPTIHEHRPFAAAGGLMSYSSDDV